jgi:hypothetical protein
MQQLKTIRIDSTNIVADESILKSIHPYLDQYYGFDQKAFDGGSLNIASLPELPPTFLFSFFLGCRQSQLLHQFGSHDCETVQHLLATHYPCHKDWLHLHTKNLLEDAADRKRSFRLCYGDAGLILLV